LDISDLNFKPCVCGYQICRFCWHHIKENLNKRCPACRRIYTDEAVEFKAVSPGDIKRLTQQKKQRERERKELDALGRRHLANVRVVQRNVVYVVGVGSRFAKEELIPTLRSNDYFGQYGKISKILLTKRNPSGGGAPIVGLYVTYHRREDAARAIAAVDGAPSPGGGRDVMRASYGTTKYCMAFLRGVSCSDHNCMNLHEWGDEKDCFTKEDLTTLKHTMKATETKRSVSTRKGEGVEGLPRAAAWGKSGVQHTVSTHNIAAAPNSSGSGSAARQTRRGGGVRSNRNTPSALDSRVHPKERKTTPGKPSSNASSSRPPTPAPAMERQTVATKKTSQSSVHPLPSIPSTSSPAPSEHISPPTDGITPSEAISSSVRPISADLTRLTVPAAPPGLPAVPPGLAAPPGLPPPQWPQPSRVDSASPQTPLLASQTSYQMSNAISALVEDVRMRREYAPATTQTTSPFPDFDRTLQTLRSHDDGFAFSLDPRLAAETEGEEVELPNPEEEANMPFHGTYLDAFPALRTGLPLFGASPGLSYAHNPSRSIYDPLAIRTGSTAPSPIERQSTGSSNYTGLFNPFADTTDDPLLTSKSGLQRSSSSMDEERRVSRFGFARDRQTVTAASSPSHVPSPLSHSNSLADGLPNVTPSPALSQWPAIGRVDLGYLQQSPVLSSPSVQQIQAQHAPHTSPIRTQSGASQSVLSGRFQPFDNSANGVSEAQLREFIQSSRNRVTQSNSGAAGRRLLFQHKVYDSQPFQDPAIMSARFGLPVGEGMYAPDAIPRASYRPPPGLSLPSGGSQFGHQPVVTPQERKESPPLILSAADFPALGSAPASTSVGPSGLDNPSNQDAPASALDAQALEKAQRKAAKKAAAVERAAERQRIAQEKAAAKAAEKEARIAQEKAEKAAAKAAALKVQQEEAEAQRFALEAAALEQEKRRLVKLEKQRQEQAERDKASRAETEKQTQFKKPNTPKKSSDNLKDGDKKALRQKMPPVDTAEAQVPLLSKKPKKNKPIAARPIRVPAKDEESPVDDAAGMPSATPSEASRPPGVRESGVSTPLYASRAGSIEYDTPTSLQDLLEEIHVADPSLDLPNHPFFDMYRINYPSKMPLEYAPLVHALSALSAGSGSFASSIPTGSIDNAVTSFQQLLETLTQTISDLLRLLPRATWGDSSSFDGVLRDMLEGDDFLEDAGEDGPGTEDEVAALTLALERRARWMEAQLSKLEELHRDINTAAVRAVLAFNDQGWERHGLSRRPGNTLQKFDNLGFIEVDDGVRPMTTDELENKLASLEEAEALAEAELRQTMYRMQVVRPEDDDY
ncbi:hypothetical protein FISHEDRAFT_43537, partial [Fistulina hepatica ATCC 64428]